MKSKHLVQYVLGRVERAIPSLRRIADQRNYSVGWAQRLWVICKALTMITRRMHYKYTLHHTDQSISIPAGGFLLGTYRI